MLKDRIEYTKKMAKEQKNFPGNIVLKERWDALKITFTNIDTTHE
jgi:hypothetical protein